MPADSFTKNGLINMRKLLYLCLFILCRYTVTAQQLIEVNDITKLNPVMVSSVLTPSNTGEIIQAVKSHEGPVSIGGGRFSMGGQTATERALQIDMRGFDSILHFSAADKEITVQTGITWRKLQEF